MSLCLTNNFLDRNWLRSAILSIDATTRNAFRTSAAIWYSPIRRGLRNRLRRPPASFMYPDSSHPTRQLGSSLPVKIGPYTSQGTKALGIAALPEQYATHQLFARFHTLGPNLLSASRCPVSSQFGHFRPFPTLLDLSHFIKPSLADNSSQHSNGPGSLVLSKIQQSPLKLFFLWPINTFAPETSRIRQNDLQNGELHETEIP